MHRGVDARLVLATLLCAGLVAGCSLFGGGDDPSLSSGSSSGSSSEPSPYGDDVQRHNPRTDSTVLPGPALLASEAVTSGSASLVGATPGGGATGPGMVQGADERLQEAKTREQLRAQKVQALITDFLQMGRDQMERGELANARSSFASALELDPDNADARSLFERAGAMLGERAETVGSIARSAAERESVRHAQARIEVDRHITEGQMALERQQFDDAIQAFENALLIVRWNPFLQDNGSQAETEIEARIDSARAAREDYRREQNDEIKRRALEEQQEREQQELARTQNRIKRFAIQANESFLRENFEDAEQYCNEILRLDPDNKEAGDLKDVAIKARHDRNQRDLRSAYKANWRAIFDDLRYKNKPVTETISFPDEEEWEKIAGRGPLLFSIEAETMPPEDQEVLQQLGEKRLSMNFQDLSLDEAVAWLRSATGIGFVVSREIIDSGSDITFTITTPGEISALRAMQYLKEFGSEPIDWRVEDGVVKIVSKDEEPRGQILQIYDIRDLTKTISNFPATDFDLKPSVSQEPLSEIDVEEPAPIVVEADKLVELIQATIEPDSWDPPNSITQVGQAALVVRHQRQVQDLIQALLQDLRSSAGTLINIETRFILAEDNFLEDIGVDFRGLNGQNGAPGTAASIPNVPLDDFGSGPPGVGTASNPTGIGTGNDAGLYYDDGADGDLRGRLEHLFDLTLGNDQIDNAGGFALEFTYLDDTAVEAIMRAVQKSDTAYVNDAPSLTVFNGQRANISVMSNVTYVRDFDVEIAQGAVVADPQVDVIRDGTILDVRPVVSADKRFVTMELRPTVAKLPRPIKEFATNLGIGNDVIIQLPELKVQRLRTTVTVPDGATLLLGGMGVLEDKDFESTMPWLSKIPIISFLVGRKGRLNTMRRLLILVKAKIIVPSELEPGRGRGGF